MNLYPFYLNSNVKIPIIPSKQVFCLLFSVFCSWQLLNAQLNGSFYFDTVKVKDWPAIHSFAYGVYGPYVLMIGGRTDGVHGKKSGFENTNSNQLIYLWNVETNAITVYHPDSLNITLKDFLNAANTNFTQDKEFLYILGGYGQSLNGDYITYPYFIKIGLEDCINRILQNRNLMPSIQYLHNDLFAVAGGQLKILDSTFYLIGGHKFTGKYDHENHSMNQNYTDAVRIFKLNDQGDTLQLLPLAEFVDDIVFHRRDFNVSPMISQSGNLELMAFSGVFQYNINRAFLNTSIITPNGYREIFDFEQKFASYSCARIGLYDSTNNQMHQVFFGGMAEYYRDSTQAINHDEYVPFVKSVSSVSRLADGSYSEILYANELPGYFGTNSEFFVNPGLTLSHPEIIDLSSLQRDTTLLGYIFGGIYNPGPMRNPWQNDSAHLTISNPYLLKSYYIKNKSTATNKINAEIKEQEISIHPNPAHNKIQISFSNPYNIQKLSIELLDSNGQSLGKYHYGQLRHPQLLLNTTGIKSQNLFLNFHINNKFLIRKQVILIK